MSRVRTTLAGFALVVLTALLAAQSPYEDAARALIASPLEVSGPRQPLLESWIERLERDPRDPLADAAIQFLRARLDEAEDPAPLAARLLALDARRCEPVAERELLLLQGALAGAHLPLDELAQRGPSLAPGWILHWWILGPLGPLGDPLALADEAGASATLSAPNVAREHVDAYGRPTRWRELELVPWQVRCAAEIAFAPDDGWMLLATAFEARASVPAWLEFDARGSLGLRAFELAQGTERATGDLGNPSFAWSLNGAAPRSVDFASAERPGLERAPVLLREGVNRLVLRAQIGGHLGLAVRVLDADGRALRFTPADAAAPLGPAPAGVLPVVPAPQSAETRLRDWPIVAREDPARRGDTELGPDARALLGVLALLDERPFDGLGELGRASELAPERAELGALYARELVGATALPESWRRSTARAAAERALAQRPELADASVLVARALVLENKEEEALPLLQRVAESGLAAAWLEQERVWPRLDLHVQAEQALDRAAELAPRSPAVLARLAAREEARGRPHAALERWEALRASGGATTDVLDALASRHAALGEHAQAIAARREAFARAPSTATRLALADALLAALRVEEARVEYERVALERPAWALPHARLADCARLGANDAAAAEAGRAAERAALERARALDPSDRVLRERLRALTGRDAVQEQMQALEADLEGERARYDGSRWTESVVRVLDTAVVRYFDDGSSETLTRNLIAVRDLAACKREGTQQFPGEALAVRVHKPDGSTREPVRTDEGWVLPGLAPDDLVEVHYRRLEPPRDDGGIGPERWLFASLEDAYQLSRLVAILPRAWEEPGPDGAPPRLVLRAKHFSGTHTVEHDGELAIHTFELRDSRRVVPEPLAAPREHFLPLVEFGARGSARAAQSRLGLVSRLKTRVSPWIRAQSSSQLAGDLARARELYERLPQLVEERGAGSGASATATLLSRRGNAAYLYAALLAAAKIDADLVWSREIAPSIEPEPDPLVVEVGRFANGLYTLVLPGTTPTWCDPNVQDMPFGAIQLDAPRAEALGGLSGRLLALPDGDASAQPASFVRAELVVDAALATRATLTLGSTGHAGHGAEQGLRSAPPAALKNQFAQQGARLVPGFQLEQLEVRGLDDAAAEPSFVLTGPVARWVDSGSRENVVSLPLPPSRLVQRFAGGEGARKLPFVLPRAQISFASARIELPQGWKVRELPADVRAEFGGGRYVQTFQSAEEGRVVEVTREVVLPPLALEAGQYAAWQSHCQKADEAERARLTFVRG